MALTLRSTKAAPLTHAEMDANLSGLADGSNWGASVTASSTILGVNTLTVSTGNLTVSTSGQGIAFATSSLLQEATNVLAQRNGTSAQAFRIYNTFTDASNYERLEIAWSSNVAFAFTEQAGTGTTRMLRFGTVGASPIEFWTTNTHRINVSSSGHLLWNTDNSLDIGASGATRPRTGYFGTSLLAPFLRTDNAATGAAVNDTVQFYGSDNSAGNTIPSFYCEGTEVLATGQADSASSVRVKMRINGTVVTLLAI